MNNSKIILSLAIIAICFVTYSNAIRCFQCTDKKSCERPSSVECNANLANSTRSYLDTNHKNVPMNTTSPYLECFREDIKTSNAEYHYKGCIYSNIRGCSLELRDYLMQGKVDRSCNQCNNKNGCNPAGRAALNLSTVFAPAIIVALIVKNVWSN